VKTPLALGVFLGLLGFLPLLGGPRYEAALAAGLVGPLWAGIDVALRSTARIDKLRALNQTDDVPRQVLGGALTAQALQCALRYITVILVVAALHGLRDGFCEPGLGWGLLLLGPCLGVLLSCQVAAFLSLILASVLPVRVSHFLFAALTVGASMSMVLGSAALRLHDIYSTPVVFAYDAYVGFFSGPIYDTVAYNLQKLLVFRIGTFFSLGAMMALMSLLVFRSSKRQTGSGVRTLPLTPGRLWALVLALVSAMASVGHAQAGKKLGFTQSADSIRSSLGMKTQAGPCTVYYSTKVKTRVARLLAFECVGHVQQLAEYFEVEPLEKVAIYLFENSEEKRDYMGAANTYIAKPWRKEIYLQPGGFPHPVLGHELAHIVAGEFGQGPFRISGLLGGLIPDPGRIEGFAEAASPHEHSMGTLHEWTAAMKKLELLPHLDSIFRLNFFVTSAARSYSAAGSFVDFVREKQGATVLKQWYGGASLEALTEQSRDELEKSWHQFLDETRVSSSVMSLSKPRFSRPGVFDRRCPHAVARARSGARTACAVQEKKSQRLRERAVYLDPLQVDLQLQAPVCAFYAGHIEKSIELSRSELEKKELYSAPARRAAQEFLGDTLWRQGNVNKAKAAYKTVLDGTFRRGTLRGLDLKLWGLQQGAQVQEALLNLLLPKKAGAFSSTLQLERWRTQEKHGEVAAYLLARVALRENRPGDEAYYLNSLNAQKLPLKSLRRETLRAKMLLACKGRMKGEKKHHLALALKNYLAHGLSPSEKRQATRVSARCEFTALHNE